MEKDITQLVDALRDGKIDASEFANQLDEVVDEVGKSARESADVDTTVRERIDYAARKASRL